MPVVAVMGGMYLFVDAIAISVIGGALLGIFLVVGGICLVGCGLQVMIENPIRKWWGWLIFFVGAPVIVGAPFAFVYFVIMDQHTVVSSESLPLWKNLAMPMCFAWLVADVAGACLLYIFLAVTTSEIADKQKLA